MKENQVCRAHWARLGVAALAAATLLGAAPASAAGQPATGQSGAFGSLPVQAGSIAPARQIEIQQYEADGAMRQADLTRHARNSFQTTGYWVKAGDTVTLDGRVRDVMGFALTFKWRVLDAAGNEVHTGTGSRGKPWQFVAKTPGQYKVLMSAVATKDGWDNSIEVHAEYQLSVEPGANPERQYPDYREGTSYQAGDVVRGRDNRFYQCRSWPRTAWCGSAARAYEPGKGWAWREAWNLFKR